MKVMKEKYCTMCKKTLPGRLFTYWGRSKKLSCCVNCNGKDKAKKLLEANLDKIIKGVETKAAKKVLDNWEQAKAVNKKLCEERRVRYEKFQARVNLLPIELRKDIRNRKTKACAVCEQTFETFPYERDNEYRWLCTLHKPKK